MTGLAIAEREPAGKASLPAVSPLNRSFDILPEEAVRLWDDGVQMPPSPEHGRMDPSRIRRSADGQWVVRCDRHKGTFPSHEHVAEWVQEQFEHLQELGLNIISRAMTASPAGETLLTVTPWLADRAMCSKAVFYTRVAPVLNRYFAGATAGSLMLSDIRKIHQYSQLQGTGEVLMHDPDQYMCRAHRLTTVPIPLD